MPGLSGIFSKYKNPEHAAHLARMVDRLWQEPFHCKNQWCEVSSGWNLGWVWDKCVPGTQGMFWNASGDLGVLFTGEEYGNALDSFFQDFDREGLQVLERLNGCFSGVIIDLRNNRAILFNDRFGLNRIYYCSTPDAFYFSTEAKSLLAVLPECRGFDERGVAEYLSTGCVLQNRSLFKSVLLLPPAAAWQFSLGQSSPNRQTYFSIKSWEQQSPLSEKDYDDALCQTFSRALPPYLCSNSGKGMSVTGGLDSRMVLAWSRENPGELPCYTFAGPYRDCADVRLGRELAEVLHQPHTTIPIDSEFLQNFPSMVAKAVYISDGTMDASGAVELYANIAARRISPVRITGNYGSEVLRANVAFRPGRLDFRYFTPEFSQQLSAAAQTYYEESVGHRLTFILTKQMPWHHVSRRSLEASQLTVRSPFLDDALVALAYRCPASLCTSAQPLMRLIQAGNPTLTCIDTDRGHSLGQPGPFAKLRRNWRECTAKAEYAYDYGMPNWLAAVDRRLKPFSIERLFLGRHKFYHFRVWYRDALSQYLRSIDTSVDALFPYRPGAARKFLAEHISGAANHTLAIHKLLGLALIKEKLLDSA